MILYTLREKLNDLSRTWGVSSWISATPLIMMQSPQPLSRDRRVFRYRSNGATSSSNPSNFYKVNYCYAYPGLDFMGTAVVFGSENKKNTAGECCDACQAFKPASQDEINCNLWAWCGDKERCGEHYQECWLKHFAVLQTAQPSHVGPDVPWTIGTHVTVDMRPAWEALVSKRKDITYEEAQAEAVDLIEDKFRKDPTPSNVGPDVPWTIGTHDTADMRHAWEGLVRKRKDITYEEAQAEAVELIEDKFRKDPTVRPFHTVTSFQGFHVQWSMRIHYYHYRKQRAACHKLLGRRCEMGGFTRLLHDGRPDQLMDEIPTVVVDALPESVVPHIDYVVLNRPYAFVEWLKVTNVPEKYIFMSEPDHVIIHLIPNFMRGESPAAFPFFYVDPVDPPNIPHIKRHTGLTTTRELEEVPVIGNSPVIMTLEDVKKVMPTWHNVTVNVFKDEAANKDVWKVMPTWHKVTVNLFKDEAANKPPYDTSYEERYGFPFFIIHYTYGLDYAENGTMLPDKVGAWHFDKRALSKPIDQNVSEPFPTVNASLTRHLIRAFNEATWAIPCWKEYRDKKGIMPKVCHEEPRGYLATPDAAMDGSIIYSTVPNPSLLGSETVPDYPGGGGEKGEDGQEADGAEE
eukprot:gene12389-15582_t